MNLVMTFDQHFRLVNIVRMSCFFLAFCCVWPSHSFAQLQDAQSWQQQTLKNLEQQIASASDRQAGNDQRKVRELQARYQWLSNWVPGEMKPQAALNSRLLEKRLEPQLESIVAAALQKELPVGADEEVFQILQRAANGHPCDPAVQQVFLKWLDDLPPRRKKYLAEIEVVSNHLICLLQNSLACDANEQTRVALDFARYRRARALAYRELPDVVEKNPIRDQAWLDRQIQSAFDNLILISGRGRTEFILLEIRMYRRAGDYGLALALLEKYGQTVLPKWYQKKRRDLLQELDWQSPYQEAAAIFAENFPEEVAKEAAAQNR